MSIIRVKISERHQVTVYKEKHIDSNDLAELGVTEEQFVQFIEYGSVVPEFQIKVSDGSSMDYMNGYHVDDALHELMNEAVSFKEGEDWISERKGYAEIEQTIMEEGEELPYS